MPSLKEIRNKISSVKSTKRIMQAMKMIATVKYAKTQVMIGSYRPYYDAYKKIISTLSKMSTKNGEKYLKQALLSIFNQTYQNWEIIFIDNCSNDKSSIIAKSFDSKKINYFFLEKKVTLYEARNYALTKCKGEFVSFLDVDDN